MSVKKPTPLIRRRQHERCPVCGEISYSRGGVHPQCSVRQADAKRVERLKRDRKVKKEAKAAAPRAWQKACPQCQQQQHVRRQICTCGHRFAVRMQHTVAQNET